ncbi:Lrp/AsnC family transcriptional regulator [Catenulispora rubra]|uniref:Lrp/AsnC family transcriptional regulator n=1 Tax=Catenulispora rubra TaxID=280293 RepID=UPI0018927EAC|nr:Lrp/AsnC family transcriptional regulator [Catenulispora rubra]
MDATDWAIIEELQADGRLSINELARRLPLSAPSVAERVRRLEAAGVITGYRAIIDPRALGLGIQALIRMGCENKISCVRRELDPAEFPEVTELHRVSGDDCSILVAHTRDIAHLEALLDRLSRWSRASTTLILSSPLQNAPLRRAVMTVASPQDDHL